MNEVIQMCLPVDAGGQAGRLVGTLANISLTLAT